MKILKKEKLSKRIEKLFNGRGIDEYSWSWECNWKLPLDLEDCKEKLIKLLVKDDEFITEENEMFIYYNYLKEWNKRFDVNGNFTYI